MSKTSRLSRVEHACTELHRDGHPVTFTTVARHTGIARSSLYRHPMLRATIEDQRHRSATSGTLTGLTDEIATLRTTLDALATRVRHHEEQIRQITARKD